ncbi:MAG: nuclear transport factor 2 family protein [Acidobacteriota bacterium]
MSSANVAIVQNIYAAFALGDAPAVFASMSPDVVWNEAENSPYADRNPYIGAAAIGEGVFGRILAAWGGFQVVSAELVDGGDTIISLGRYVATNNATGKPLDAQCVHVWCLANGKVISFQQYTDTLQWTDAMKA